ncbi:unnamed protein product [Prorocentrum cordatum]|uniref:Uncharacterized protein n=1 Tax=Prorocentrum cordatum TaxID=2364126 RepID=A0ABN9TYS6_9DINO|nr:unnamed protein product [Polarella glacialis]
MTRPRRPSPLGRPGLRATPPLPQLVCLAVALLGQPAASARAPRRAHGVLRASSQAGAAHVLSQHGVIRRPRRRRRTVGGLRHRSHRRAERADPGGVGQPGPAARRAQHHGGSQSELRRRQLAADIARLSDQSSRQEGERAAAAAGLQEVDEHFAELRRRRESQVAERVARRLADEKLLLALENDTNVAMGLVNYTRCSESAASAALLSSQTRTRRARTSPRRSPRGAAVLPAHAHTAHFPAAPSRLCRSAGSRLYLHGDHRVQAWLQHVTALPRAQHLFHQVLGSLASRASFVKTSRAHRDDEYTYVVGPMVSDAAEDTCDTSLVMSEENMETKCTKRAASMGCSVIIDPGCTGDDNWRMCYYQTIDDLIALGDSYLEVFGGHVYQHDQHDQLDQLDGQPHGLHQGSVQHGLAH